MTEQTAPKFTTEGTQHHLARTITGSFMDIRKCFYYADGDKAGQLAYVQAKNGLTFPAHYLTELYSC